MINIKHVNCGYVAMYAYVYVYENEKYETMQVWVIRLLQLKLVIRKLILSVNNKKSREKNKVSLR